MSAITWCPPCRHTNRPHFILGSVRILRSRSVTACPHADRNLGPAGLPAGFHGARGEGVDARRQAGEGVLERLLAGDGSVRKG
jgi:hypothetical protein